MKTYWYCCFIHIYTFKVYLTHIPPVKFTYIFLAFSLFKIFNFIYEDLLSNIIKLHLELSILRQGLIGFLLFLVKVFKDSEILFFQ